MGIHETYRIYMLGIFIPKNIISITHLQDKRHLIDGKPQKHMTVSKRNLSRNIDFVTNTIFKWNEMKNACLPVMIKYKQNSNRLGFFFNFIIIYLVCLKHLNYYTGSTDNFDLKSKQMNGPPNSTFMETFCNII